jgi:hypothetical protein
VKGFPSTKWKPIPLGEISVDGVHSCKNFEQSLLFIKYSFHSSLQNFLKHFISHTYYASHGPDTDKIAFRFSSKMSFNFLVV